ncbi:MAG: putative rane protein [Herbinix sp.]|jgi:LCP family protein required for cell wall assembly|nr:putative rane protein [Herbinix sp.]
MQDRREEEILKQQVLDIMNEDNSENEQVLPLRSRQLKPVKKKKHRFGKAAGLFIVAFLIIVGLILGTKGGRSLLYGSASKFIFNNVDNEDIIKEYQEESNNNYEKDIRQEDYITNYLIFGIEEFGGARNTDSIMIASINTKDDTLKLTSLLRDSYVEIPDHKANKLNSAYSKGGARMLVDTVELNYKIQIDGYVSVDFKSFEKIVDLLGGVTIELGKEEAKYLNTTNYISKKSNRNVKAGVNLLNGNQVMGYCRVRKVKTLGGANNDYGRIIRQQRALKAIFDSYKSPKNLFKILSVTKEGLGYVTTNLTQSQIEKAISDIIENKIKTLDTFRIPVDGAFDAPKKYNGIGYPIVLDWDANRIELYKFIFHDTEKEAIAALASQ